MPRILTSGVIAAIAAFCATSAVADSCPFYENPVRIRLPGGGLQTNCADPSVLRGQNGDPYWYALCTTDSLSDEDVDEAGVRRTHLLPMLRSRDLVSWEYMGDAFTSRPAWVADGAGLWAPELAYRNGRYFLYYVATDVADEVSGEPGCTSDNAIGVATSASPLGPWVDLGSPVVEPRRAGGGCNFFWTYDPDVLVTSSGRAVLYYGSYYGGLEARELSSDGLATDPETATPIAIPNRYEGANVVEKDGAYWLFASASNCCNGPLTGYQVFAARADDPFGPFVDREGVSLLDSRVGGSPVLTTNGNRWVGTGHGSTFQDANGDWYMAYHAIDRDDPYFADATGYSRRPLLVDRLRWTPFPTVRGGRGASDSVALGPAARRQSRRDVARRHLTEDAIERSSPESWLVRLDALVTSRLPLVAEASDELDGATSRLSWLRQPAPEDVSYEGGALRLATQAGELFGGTNDASVLAEPAPAGDWLAETAVALNVPSSGCCFNYVQAGLVVSASDDDYVKLTHASIWETRQIEFAKEVSQPLPGHPAYGSSVGGPPGEKTWLRIAKVVRDGAEQYVSYSSRDGVTFVRGGTWSHALGDRARIGLVAFGGRGFEARFDHLRVWRLPRL